MPLPHFIVNPLLPCLSTVLHHSPFKTRLGGISTITAKTPGLLPHEELGDNGEPTLARSMLRSVLFERNFDQVRDYALELISQMKSSLFTPSKHLFTIRLVPIIVREQPGMVHDVLAAWTNPDKALAGEFHLSRLFAILGDA